MTPAEFKSKRQELGLTQSQLAQVLGMIGNNSDVTIRRWEMDPSSPNSRPPNPIPCKVLLNWNTAPCDW